MPSDRPPSTDPWVGFVLSCCHCRLFRTAADDWTHGPPPPGSAVSHGICPPCLVEHYPGVRPPAEAPWPCRLGRDAGADKPPSQSHP